MQNKKPTNIRARTEGAVLVALGFVLSFVKLYELPNGGSLTPAMFPIILYGLRWGLGRGLAAGFVFGLMQLLFDGAYAWGWQSMILDYLLAFTPLGLTGLFKGKAWGIFHGTVIGCLGRFIVHHISGVTIYRIIEPTEVPGFGTFDNAHLYSLVYNGSYMIPNMILALLLAALLYKPMKRYFAGSDLLK
jgi:thiamine transporter